MGNRTWDIDRKHADEFVMRIVRMRIKDTLEEARVILPDHTGHDDRRDGATVCSTTLGWATSPFF